MKMRGGKVHIGTSGWTYGHWREVVYPKGVSAAARLSWLARLFPTVEVNTSFYRIPSSESVAAWVKQTPADFRFALKLWRGITHYRKLRNCREFLERFFSAFAPLPAPKRGPLLIQMAPQQRKNLPKLRTFLKDLRDVLHGRRWKVAIEFRHDSWLDDEIYRLLDRRRIAICLHDIPKGKTTRANDARFVYIRRHGLEAVYQGLYSRKQLEEDADAIRGWRAEGKDVFVYFNNDAKGNAFRNAVELRELLEA